MEAFRLVSEVSMSETDFNTFWRVAARRVAKGDAERAWIKATRLAAPEVIVEAMEEYAAACAEMGKEPQYTCHPATWLNGKRWLDDRAEWWGREQVKRTAWLRKRGANIWWATLPMQEQCVIMDNIMADVRKREEWDPIRQAWERDYAAGATERFAIEGHKRSKQENAA